MPKPKPFRVGTYNAHDVGLPPNNLAVCYVTERPTVNVLKQFCAQHGLEFKAWFRGTDAFIWNPERFAEHGTNIIHAWRSGRFHGKPGTTPEGYVESLWGELDGEKVAFVGSHLVNNAFGENLRGERELRLKLWYQGWRAIRAEVWRLRKLGYKVVFKLGDFNRRPGFWKDILKRSIGVGYDRVIHPGALVDLLGQYRGEFNGSDHRPLIGVYRFRDDA